MSNDLDNPIVERSTLVPIVSGNRSGSLCSGEERFAANGSQRAPAPAIAAKELCAGGVAYLTKMWRESGFDKRVVDTIINSWSKNTRKQYDGTLREWGKFIAKESLPVMPSVMTLCQFLSELDSKGKSFSTVASHKSALVTIFELISGQKLSQNVLISRYMKGLFRMKPPGPKYATTWDVDIVLDHIRGWGPNAGLDLMKLTMKVTFLLAICCPRRVSELAELNMNWVQRDSSKWTFHLNYRNKTRKSGPPQVATYEVYQAEPLLCPLRALVDYVKRTSQWRTEDQFLLRSYKSHAKVTGSTVSRWIKSILAEAGVSSSFGAHSTRGASTSKAYSSGLPLSLIMKAASWSERSGTFNKFYYREPISYQNNVLAR